MMWHAAEKLANLQQRERTLRVEQFTGINATMRHCAGALGSEPSDILCCLRFPLVVLQVFACLLFGEC
jgi:hypothetical protein